ncbi:hypothetical protein [Vibrio phage vB_VpaP_M3]|nr:hypothetical protein [Vibrio phage vB_VpaP_M3]
MLADGGNNCSRLSVRPFTKLLKNVALKGGDSLASAVVLRSTSQGFEVSRRTG